MGMMDRVAIEPRFQRAIRIDTDLGDSEALRGFVCPPSSVAILESLADHVSETGQAAFTWTGPYGSGKSSLVIALSALLGNNPTLREEAASIIGHETANAIWKKLPLKQQGWRIIGAVGRKDDTVQIMGEAIEQSGYADAQEWTEKSILETLYDLAQQSPDHYGGLVVFVDEMGKMLEATTRGTGDIYILQQLAELASRSNGRLILVGILHQGFEEYAARLSHSLRDDWTKIHGRFVDLPVNVGGEEQVAILSKAISGTPPNEKHMSAVRSTADVILVNRAGTSSEIIGLLASCWPLHPATAALLGPISRRRFGQNQRSIFGFLNSAEPYGFREFLRSAEESELYGPDRLWDYLRTNLEPAILSSPDGHRWAMAVEAIDRCAAFGGDAQYLSIMKTIAVIDLFKDRSGLVPGRSVLMASMVEISAEELDIILKQLRAWSLIVFRKFSNAYGVFAGSDFDIETALAEQIERHPHIDMNLVRSLSGLQPVLGKRHYHATGALRWFDVELVQASSLEKYLDNFTPAEGTIGAFVLVVPDNGERHDTIREHTQALALKSRQWDLVLGVSYYADHVVKLALEVQGLESVRMLPDLQGDAVARREVNARLSEAQGRFEGEVQKAMDTAEWFHATIEPRVLRSREASELASDLADARFRQAPYLPNELLNRLKPSSNAVAAQNSLLRYMIRNVSQKRLGIEGYPAEGGLYLSLLNATRLHRKIGDDYDFVDPGETGEDPARLGPLWEATQQYLKSNEHRAVPLSELYTLWSDSPFGVKRGLMPILTVAFMQSMKSSVALYRERIFQSVFKELDLDYLVKDSNFIQLRWMNLNESARNLLSSLADLVRDLDKGNELINLEPIDVGRGLVTIFDRTPPWTKRTMRLSTNATAVRNIFSKANDPNKLIFNDLPGLFSSETAADGIDHVVSNVRLGLEEIVNAYPTLLNHLRTNLLKELQVPNQSPKAIEDLRARADNIRDVTGDFNIEAFVGRLANFRGTDADIEGLASLAVSRPSRDWSDADIDRIALSLAEFSQKFNRAEAFAHVKGRSDRRESMAIIVRSNGNSAPIYGEFDISDTDNSEVDALVERLQSNLGNTQNSLVLAALARLSSRLLEDQETERDTAIEHEESL